MKILVVGPSWVGDMCMAQSLFKLLKQSHPQADIDVLAPAWSQALLDRMPEVNTSIILPFGHGEFEFLARVRFGRSLRKAAYDWAIVLPNSWKSAVVPWAAGIKKRTGWLGEGRYGLLNDWQKLEKASYPLMIQRFAAVVDFKKGVLAKNDIPIPQLEPDVEQQKNLLTSLKLNLEKPVLILCPGAEYGATKIWPANYYAEVAQHYLDQQWQVWLLGSPNDETTAQAIEQMLTPAADFKNLVGQTKLGDAVDLLACAQSVVANDSGLMHIAAALGQRTLAIYGSTSPAFTPPLGDAVDILQVENLYCRPCFKRECAEKHLRCLRDITSDQVVKVLAQSA